MLFNSYEFILAFLPVTLVGFWAARKQNLEKTAKCILILASLYFYAYFHIEYVFIIVGSVLLNKSAEKAYNNGNVVF